MDFDKAADSYDQWYETALGRFADAVETQLVLELFPLQKGDLVLDAGCGTGNFSLKLARKGVRVIGVDISPAMLAVAREKAARQGLEISFREMDFCKLDFRPASFDAVLSVTAFEFMPEPDQAYAELMRVLKPGGHLLIGVISRDSAWGEMYREQAKRPDSVFRHARLFTMDELLDLDRKNLRKWGESLFVGPDATEEQLNPETESRLAKKGKGGFIAALWKKPC